jgi:hypothetical protein
MASIGFVGAFRHIADGSTAATPTQSPVLASPTPTLILQSPSALPSPSTTASPSPAPAPTLYVNILDGDQYGNVRAETEAGATCSLRVALPNGSDAGWVTNNPQKTRTDGIVEWIYRQLPTDEGIGMHIVSCSLNGLSGTAWIYFEVGS